MFCEFERGLASAITGDPQSAAARLRTARDVIASDR
jgi:hypothetical protein